MKEEHKKQVVVVGAGPSGLICTKTAKEFGFGVTTFDRNSSLGGIWNPTNGAIYDNVRMQNSRLAFHYASQQPLAQDGFLGAPGVTRYLTHFAESHGLLPHLRLGTRVTGIQKRNQSWRVTTESAAGTAETFADYVCVAIGEHWVPKQLRIPGLANFRGEVIPSKEYRRPEQAAGKRVVVIGGGVSGADIAADISSQAASVEWSVRSLGLFLPNTVGSHYNDELFSYVGRYAAAELSNEAFIALLDEQIPEYMAMYRATGLIPKAFQNNALHVNDHIVRKVYSGRVAPRPSIDRIDDEGRIVYQDGTVAEADVIVSCIGYEVPNYSFIDGFAHSDLYEHFLYSKDPTLSVVSPPIDTMGFGAAFPYFEVIARWIFSVHAGKIGLPAPAELRAWCETHMNNLSQVRFYDSWLETIRLALRSGVLPDPGTRFSAYWAIISSVVSPSNLNPAGGRLPQARPGTWDHLMDLERCKIRILAGLSEAARERLLASSEITQSEFESAARVRQDEIIPLDLSYDQDPRHGEPLVAEPARVGTKRAPLARDAAVFVMPHYSDSDTMLDYLARAVASIRGQDDSNWHLVIIDDCSTYAPARGVLEQLAKDPRIHVLYCDKNSGPGVCRNLGIQRAAALSAPYVLYLDSDDEAPTDRLSRVRRIFARQPDVDVIYGAFTVIDEAGETVPFDRLSPSIQEIVVAGQNTPLFGHKVWQQMATITGYINMTSATAVRTQLAVRHPFPPTRVSEDYTAWLRYAVDGFFHYDDHVHCFYRIPQRVDGSMTRDRLGRVAFYQDKSRIDWEAFSMVAELAMGREYLGSRGFASAAAKFFIRSAETCDREGFPELARENLVRANEMMQRSVSAQQ